MIAGTETFYLMATWTLPASGPRLAQLTLLVAMIFLVVLVVVMMLVKPSSEWIVALVMMSMVGTLITGLMAIMVVIWLMPDEWLAAAQSYSPVGSADVSGAGAVYGALCGPINCGRRCLSDCHGV